MLSLLQIALALIRRPVRPMVAIAGPFPDQSVVFVVIHQHVLLQLFPWGRCMAGRTGIR
jgi:hypothetical protein